VRFPDVNNKLEVINARNTKVNPRVVLKRLPFRFHICQIAVASIKSPIGTNKASLGIKNGSFDQGQAKRGITNNP
jgi:hypothetical protein